LEESDSPVAKKQLLKNEKDMAERHDKELREMYNAKCAVETELEQSKIYCKSYLAQLAQGGDMVKELQKEIKTKTETIHELKDEIKVMEIASNTLRAQVKSHSESPTVTVQEFEILQNELLNTKKDNEEANRKILKLEKINGGQKPQGRGRVGGGYDANIDRISDLEDELDLLKVRFETAAADHVNKIKDREQETMFYKDQSAEYLIKLQEVIE
jgi:chromosome segregation ATPase